MAQIFTISYESDTSDEQGDADQVKASETAEPSSSGQYLLVKAALRETRHRNLSMNEEDLQESGAGRLGDVGADSFRRRSSSAPPALWAAKKYGRQLRKMSDEFDILLGKKELKRVKSAGAARQMQTSPSWFTFLWSHKESDTETSNLTTSDSRPAE